jgi:hypothetical protein
MRPDETDPKLKTNAPDGRDPMAELPRGDTAEESPRQRARAGSPDGVTMSWHDIKSRFVDDPQGALAAAEELVQSTVEEKVRALKDEAAAVCARGRDEDESSTEVLRTRLLRCLDYCERLAGTMPH